MIFDGFRALRGHKPIVGSFLADINAMVFGMPQALFPPIAAHRFPDQPSFYGLMVASIPVRDVRRDDLFGLDAQCDTSWHRRRGVHRRLGHRDRVSSAWSTACS